MKVGCGRGHASLWDDVTLGRMGGVKAGCGRGDASQWDDVALGRMGQADQEHCPGMPALDMLRLMDYKTSISHLVHT